jgi:hypothetical protein
MGCSDFANGKDVERARRGTQSGFGDMQITGRGLEIAMPQQHLDGAQFSASIEQTRGKEWRSTCGLSRLAMPNCLHKHSQVIRTPDAYIGPVRPFSGKEPVLRLPPTPVSAQQLQQLGREHDLTWIASLALADVDDHPLAVNVSDLQIEGFLATQPGTVVHGQQSPMLRVRRDVEQGADLFPAPHRRQLAAHLGLGNLGVEPALLQRAYTGTSMPT